jgi:hypothetical protein
LPGLLRVTTTNEGPVKKPALESVKEKAQRGPSGSRNLEHIGVYGLADIELLESPDISFPGLFVMGSAHDLHLDLGSRHRRPGTGFVAEVAGIAAAAADQLRLEAEFHLPELDDLAWTDEGACSALDTKVFADTILIES